MCLRGDVLAAVLLHYPCRPAEAAGDGVALCFMLHGGSAKASRVLALARAITAALGQILRSNIGPVRGSLSSQANREQHVKDHTGTSVHSPHLEVWQNSLRTVW